MNRKTPPYSHNILTLPQDDVKDFLVGFLFSPPFANSSAKPHELRKSQRNLKLEK